LPARGLRWWRRVRHPIHRRVGERAAAPDQLHRVRRRERSGAVSDPADGADRGRRHRGRTRAGCAAGRLQAVRDVQRASFRERLKRYGMIVADQGSSWFIAGAADTRWDDTDLNQLKTVPGTAFEVVQLGTIYRP